MSAHTYPITRLSPFTVHCLKVACNRERFCHPEGGEKDSVRLYDELDAHGLSAVVYPSIRDCDRPPPAHFLDRLRRAHETALLYKDYCIQKLGALAPRLCRNGRVVMLKGLALCETVYREPLIRPMTDVDLLLPDDTIADVRSALATAGFSRVMNYTDVWQDDVMQIDLHSDLWDARRIPARSVIAPRIPFESLPSAMIPGVHITTPALHYAHGVWHGIKHGFSRAVWLLDLALLARSGAPDALPPGALGVCGSAAQTLLNEAGLTDAPATPPGGLRGRLLMRALHRGTRPGMGEVALALCAPSWGGSLRYLGASILPPATVLEEMYGNRPYALLLAARCAAMARRCARVVLP